MEKENKPDEIDLLELLLKGINIVRSNFWLIVSFFLLGTALGLVHYFISRKSFENKMMITSNILTNSYSKILIDNINKQLGRTNTKLIVDQLNISEKTAEQIGHIKIENVTEAEELKESERFIISVEVFDENILPELQQGLIYYIENNEFVKIRVEQNKSYLKQMISKLDQEIKDMEEFKLRIFKGNFFQRTDGNIMFDPTAVNSKIIELTKEKLNLQNSLGLANSVQVIEGFTKFESPVQPKLSVSLASGSMLGLFLVAMLIFFKSIRQLLRLADGVRHTTP